MKGLFSCLTFGLCEQYISKLLRFRSYYYCGLNVVPSGFDVFCTLLCEQHQKYITTEVINVYFFLQGAAEVPTPTATPSSVLT